MNPSTVSTQKVSYHVTLLITALQNTNTHWKLEIDDLHELICTYNKLHMCMYMAP